MQVLRILRYLFSLLHIWHQVVTDGFARVISLAVSGFLRARKKYIYLYCLKALSRLNCRRSMVMLNCKN